MLNKKLDLDTLLSKNEKIYIMNNALRSQLLMVIAMRDRHGRHFPLKVPPVSVPICLSEQYSAEVISESQELRQALRKGVLKLVAASEAERILSTSDAQEELSALQLSVYSDSVDNNSVRDNMERLKNKAEPQVTEATSLLDQDPLDKSQGVSVRLKGILAGYQNKDKSAKDTLTQLKRIKGSLNETDLTYVISQCKDDASIREFAEELLSQLSPEQPF